MAEPQPPAQRPLNVRPQDALNEVRREMPLQNAPAVVPVDNPPRADVPAANNAPPVENPGAAHVAPPLEVHNCPVFLFCCLVIGSGFAFRGFHVRPGRLDAFGTRA